MDTIEQQNATGVGALLKASRVRIGEDLREIASILKIRYVYLEAIEDSRFEDLPGVTYTRGFVRAYAEHLGLDSDEVMRRFKTQDYPGGSRSQLDFPEPIPETSMPGGAIILIGVVVTVLAYGMWYLNTSEDSFFADLIAPLPERLAKMTDQANLPGPAGGRPDTAQPSPAAPAEAPAKDTMADKPRFAETTRAQDKPAEPMPQAQGTDSQSEPAETAEPAAQHTEPAETAEPAAQAEPEKTAEATSAAAPETAPETASTPAPTPAPEPVRAPAVVPMDMIPPARPAAGAAPASQAAPAPEPAPETASAPQTAAVTAGPSSVAAEGSRIVVRAKTNSWIQVRDDNANELLLTRLLRAGDSYTVPGRSGLMLSTGNAGALEILVDGTAVPPIGGVGVVRRKVLLDADKLKAGTAANE